MAEDYAPTTLETVLVIENGSGFLKCGWAGDDRPRISVPSAIAPITAKVQQLTA